MNNINVLLVDDAKMVLEVSANSLKREFNVFTALNGKEAWEMLKSQKFDCLVTDVNMPVMDGIELIRKMKENNLDIKTIVISSKYDLFTNKEYAEVTADATFRKPYPPSDLVEMIKTLLEK